MAELTRTIKGQMIISGNEIEEKRQVFTGLNIETLRLKHTVGGCGGVDRQELLIRS
jgi:DNA adenine methylase